MPIESFTDEFKTEVKRQLCHTTIKRDYLQHRIDTDIRDESAQNRAKKRVELDAIQKKIDDLEAMKKWLYERED
jgi:hypothetical protein